jgi:hypothetical protein
MEARLEANVMKNPDQTHVGPKIDGPESGAARPKTGGRKPGARNKRSVLHDGLAEICRTLTAGNYRWRRNLKALCDSPEIFDKPHLVAVLLSHGFGKPTPKAPETERKSPLLFVTQHPIGSYDPLAAKAAALLERKRQAALPPAGESYVPPDPTDPDALVVIEPAEPDTVAASMIRPAGR